MNVTLAALAGSLVLSTACVLAPAVARLPDRYRKSLESFSGGTGLAYVFLYLLFELSKNGAPKIHALLPLGPEPLETVFILLVASVSIVYLLQVRLSKSAERRDDYLGFVGLFLVYNFLAGASTVEEAIGGPVALGLYVTALGLHLHFNELFLLHLCPEAHHSRWRIGLATMPLAGCAAAVAFALPDGALYGLLCLIAGGAVVNVLRHELPSPENMRFIPFVSGVVSYGVLVIATWRF